MLFFIVLVIGIVLVFYLASYEEVAPILLGILVGGISFLLFDFPFYWSVILSITVGIVFLAMHENAKIFWIQSLFIFIILSITSFKLFNWLNFKIIQCIIAALIYSIEYIVISSIIRWDSDNEINPFYGILWDKYQNYLEDRKIKKAIKTQNIMELKFLFDKTKSENILIAILNNMCDENYSGTIWDYFDYGQINAGCISDNAEQLLNQTIELWKKKVFGSNNAKMAYYIACSLYYITKNSYKNKNDWQEYYNYAVNNNNINAIYSKIIYIVCYEYKTQTKLSNKDYTFIQNKFYILPESEEKQILEAFCKYNGYGFEKDINFAINIWKEFSLSNPIAMNNLGFCYYYGIGLEKNEQVSYELFSKAFSTLKKTYIATNLGNSLWEYKKNRLEAVNLYMYSNNNRNNMFTLDSLLLCNGIDKEIEVANFCSQNSTIPSSFVESLFLKAVKKDDLNNKLQYANYLSTKKDVRRLYQAYVYYEEAVTNGMDEYELNMEEIISKICSVLEKNISTYSFKNYEEIYIKCAEYGNLKCQEKVANNYFQINSSLVENEHLVAFKYYLNLVNNNVLYNPFFKLAECYRLGIGTHKNFQLAGDYYKIFIESISEDNYLKNKYRDEYNTAKKHLQKLYDMNYWEKESLNIPVNQDDNLSEEEKMLIYMNEKYSKTGGLIAAGLYDEAALNFRLILEGFLTSMLNLSGLECSEERSFDRIEFLEKNSVIDSTISSYCHRIRKIGNEGAHLSSNTSLNKSILFNISNITNKLISYFSTEITKNN